MDAKDGNNSRKKKRPRILPQRRFLHSNGDNDVEPPQRRAVQERHRRLYHQERKVERETLHPPPEDSAPRGTERKRGIPPPPSPPPSLVSLLKSDPDVLAYFQSLQQNLDADVKVWQNRARSWEAKYRKARQATDEARGKNGSAARVTLESSERRCANRRSHGSDRTAVTTTKMRTSREVNDMAAHKASKSNKDRVRSRKTHEKAYEDTSEVESVDDNVLLDLMEQSTSSSSSDDDSHTEGLNGKNVTGPGHSYHDDEDDDVDEMNKHDGVKHEIDDAALRKLLLESSSSSSCTSLYSEEEKSDLHHVDAELDVHSGLEAIDFEGNDRNDDEIRRRYWEEAFTFLRDKLGVSSLQEFENQKGENNDESINVEPPPDGYHDKANVESPEDRNDNKIVVETPEEERTTHSRYCRTASKRDSSFEDSRLYCSEQVISEIMTAIRTICRLQRLLSEIDQEHHRIYSPFRPVTLLPASDEIDDINGNRRGDTRETEQSPHSFPPHPAILAKHQLVRAVSILDSFRPAQSGRRKAQDHGLPLGEIIHNWLLSLQGEIAESWACHDRAQQRTNTALVFESAVDRDTEYDLSSDTRTTEQDLATGRSSVASAVDIHGDASNQIASFCATSLAPQKPFAGGPKSQNRLSNLLQRYWLAQLVVGVLLIQGNVVDAYSLVIAYIRSNASTMREGPRLAPTLSFVVLRGLLHPGIDRTSTPRSWLKKYLASREDDKCRSLVVDSLSLVLRHTFFLWSARLMSTDDRIVDLSHVEVASWRELIRTDGDWLNITDDSSGSESIKTLAASNFRQLSSDSRSNFDESLLSDAFQLALVLNGDENATKLALIENLQRQDLLGRARSLAASLALRQLVLRKVDVLKESVGHATLHHGHIHSLASLELKGLLENASLSTICNVMECAQLLADGKTACSAIEKLLKKSRMDEMRRLISDGGKYLFNCVHTLCDTPMVRVINLQRRSDRLDAFRAQALRENLLMILAVPECSLESDDSRSQSDCFMHGCHAIDGGGRKADIHERLSRQLGSHSRLSSFVNVHWRPNDLKAFDENAPSDEGLATLSDSEIACALSHIASWKGSLRSFHHSSSTEYSSEIFRHPRELSRLFRLGGFAKGDALLSANSSMEPAAVCVILEDDAILAERFRERLEEILQELPRDFFFCSLGYGRPKSAPILPFGKHIGIPSHLFYLTGYLVSDAGCRYLLDSMPVTGPVDAWIGLKMTQNWENSFGDALGVGSHQFRRKADAAPSRKQLGQILEFRAYCALTPLCSQRIENSSGTGTEGRTWRLRDTDIVYSGDSACRGLR